MDLIERQAVLSYIDRILHQGTGKNKSFEFMQKYVEELPSVTPVITDAIWAALSKVYNMDGVPDEAKSIIGDVMLGLPSAQPEIIHCRDCKYAINIGTPDMMCKNSKAWVVATDNDFGCVFAERRHDG